MFGARNVGRAVVADRIAAGWRAVAVARTDATLDALREAHPGVLTVRGDAADHAVVAEAIARAERVEGGVRARHRHRPPAGGQPVGHDSPPDVAGAEDDEDGWPAHAGSLTTRAAGPPAVDSAG